MKHDRIDLSPSFQKLIQRWGSGETPTERALQNKKRPTPRQWRAQQTERIIKERGEHIDTAHERNRADLALRWWKEATAKLANAQETDVETGLIMWELSYAKHYLNKTGATKKKEWKV